MHQPADLLQVTLQTVSATQRPNASQQELDAVGQLFDQLKTRHVGEVAGLSAQLASEAMSLEVQHFGFQLLQHLVTYRWGELSETERQQLARGSQTLLVNTGNTPQTWAVRSKAALLVALVTKRMGQPFWETMLPELVAYAGQGPVQAEKVCMVLRLVTEEVTWTNDSNAGAEVQKWRREMLASMFTTLDTILPFLHAAVESHFGRAMELFTARDMQGSNAHAAVVTAALAALAEFAEVAPVSRLSKCGVISACAFLLSVDKFRTEACELLRRIAARKQGQTQEEEEGFQAAMAEAGEALIRGAETVLAPQHAGELGWGGALEEFAQFLCVSMGIWGDGHLASLPPDRRVRFLQLSIQFTQQEYSLLAHKALPMWVGLLSAAERGQRSGKEQGQLPPDCIVTLMDLAGEKMRTSVHLVEETAQVPECFDSFEEYRGFLLEHRELLSRIVKLAAALLPEQALQAAERRLQQAIQVCSTSTQFTEEQRIMFEAGTYFVESVVNMSSQTYLPGGKRRPAMVANVGPDTVNCIIDRQESMFRLLLGLHYNDPAMITYHTRLLEAFVRLLALRKELAAPAIQKVFDMFNDLPMEGGPWHLPHSQPPAWKERFQARSKIPGVLVTYAKNASEVMRVHVEAVAVKTEECWSAKTISPGERALLCDMMVASVCGADLAFQQQVVEHVLRSTHEEWQSPAWLGHTATPAALVAHFCPVLRSPPASFEIGAGFTRWMAAHHLQLIERAIKRLPASADAGAPDCQQPGSPAWHVLNPHLHWILPTILHLVINLHKLSTPQGTELLMEAAPALEMGARERALYLRQLTKGRQAGDAEILAEEGATIAGNNVAALRSWFRVTRESLYQILGHLLRNTGGFYACTDLQAQWVEATTGCLDSLHHSHMRMLIRHILLPLVKACPPVHRRAWLLPVLAVVLPHVHQRLSGGWSAVLRGSGAPGAAAASMGTVTREDSAAANEEIVQERLLRELTAEHLLLLRGTQESPMQGEGAGQQSVLQLTWLESPTAAMAACMTAVAALWWPDDAVVKASSFLRGVVAVAGRQALDESSAAEIMKGCIQAIGTGISSQSAEVLGLARDVMVLQPPLNGPRGVLLTLPRATPALLESLEHSLAGTHSEKEQRAAVKHFLCEAGSEELQAALSDWRVSSLANVSQPRRHPKVPNADETGAAVGLAAVQGAC